MTLCCEGTFVALSVARSSSSKNQAAPSSEVMSCKPSGVTARVVSVPVVVSAVVASSTMPAVVVEAVDALGLAIQAGTPEDTAIICASVPIGSLAVVELPFR